MGLSSFIKNILEILHSDKNLILVNWKQLNCTFLIELLNSKIIYWLRLYLIFIYWPHFIVKKEKVLKWLIYFNLLFSLSRFSFCNIKYMHIIFSSYSNSFTITFSFIQKFIHTKLIIS